MRYSSLLVLFLCFFPLLARAQTYDFGQFIVLANVSPDVYATGLTATTLDGSDTFYPAQYPDVYQFSCTGGTCQFRNLLGRAAPLTPYVVTGRDGFGEYVQSWSFNVTVCPYLSAYGVPCLPTGRWTEFVASGPSRPLETLVLGAALFGIALFCRCKGVVAVLVLVVYVVLVVTLHSRNDTAQAMQTILSTSYGLDAGKQMARNLLSQATTLVSSTQTDVNQALSAMAQRQNELTSVTAAQQMTNSTVVSTSNTLLQQAQTALENTSQLQQQQLNPSLLSAPSASVRQQVVSIETRAIEYQQIAQLQVDWAVLSAKFVTLMEYLTLLEIDVTSVETAVVSNPLSHIAYNATTTTTSTSATDCGAYFCSQCADEYAPHCVMPPMQPPTAVLMRFQSSTSAPGYTACTFSLNSPSSTYTTYLQSNQRYSPYQLASVVGLQNVWLGCGTTPGGCLINAPATGLLSVQCAQTSYSTSITNPTPQTYTYLQL